MCYNCEDAGHIGTKCTKPKMEKSRGKVFALNAEEVEEPDNLIRGICFINNTHLLAIIDTGETRSFITFGCVKRSNLVLSPMLRGMVIDTLTNGSVTTSLVCLDFLVILVMLILNWILLVCLSNTSM